MSAVEFILAGMLAAATPFLLAALGELVVERAGVLNLGVEGMMIMGAAVGFAGAVTLDSSMAGLAIGALAGMLAAMLAGWLSMRAHLHATVRETLGAGG